MLDLDGLVQLCGAARLAVPPGALFAYVGLGPGQEFIPYFLSLLGFLAAALVAVVQWPFFGMLRWFRRTDGQSIATRMAEAPRDDGQNHH